MQCNIDERGQRVRRWWGAACLVAAAGLAGAGIWSGVWWWYGGTAVLAASGAFAFYEARKRWCIVRALGIKTPI